MGDTEDDIFDVCNKDIEEEPIIGTHAPLELEMEMKEELILLPGEWSLEVMLDVELTDDVVLTSPGCVGLRIGLMAVFVIADTEIVRTVEVLVKIMVVELGFDSANEVGGLARNDEKPLEFVNGAVDRDPVFVLSDEEVA